MWTGWLWWWLWESESGSSDRSDEEELSLFRELDSGMAPRLTFDVDVDVVDDDANVGVVASCSVEEEVPSDCSLIGSHVKLSYCDWHFELRADEVVVVVLVALVMEWLREDLKFREITHHRLTDTAPRD